MKARVYIDSTGDGDLAALAGAPFEVGGQDFAGLNMSTTQGSRWAGANLRVYEAAEEAFRKEQVEQGVENPLPLVYVLEEEAIKRGEMSRHVCNRSKGFFRVLIPNTPDEDAEFVTFSFHSYYCHNTDAEDISRQILEQHQLMKQFHAFLKNNVPASRICALSVWAPCPECAIAAVSSVSTCSNRVMWRVAQSSMTALARFPEMFDTHHPTSPDWVFMRHIHIGEQEGSAVCEKDHVGVDCDCQMHPFGVPAGIPARSNPKDWCEIPYRCLLPQNVDNLLTAGRCCSAEFHANGAMRIIGPAMGTGHAAGVAASVAIKEDSAAERYRGHAYSRHASRGRCQS